MAARLTWASPAGVSACRWRGKGWAWHRLAGGVSRARNTCNNNTHAMCWRPAAWDRVYKNTSPKRRLAAAAPAPPNRLLRPPRPAPSGALLSLCAAAGAAHHDAPAPAASNLILEFPSAPPLPSLPLQLHHHTTAHREVPLYRYILSRAAQLSLQHPPSTAVPPAENAALPSMRPDFAMNQTPIRNTTEI